MESILGRRALFEGQLRPEGTLEDRVVLDHVVGLCVEAETVPVVLRADGATHILTDRADRHGRAVEILGQQLRPHVAYDVALGVGFTHGRLYGRDLAVEHRHVVALRQLGLVCRALDDGHRVEPFAEKLPERLHAFLHRCSVLLGCFLLEEGLVVGVSPDVEYLELGLPLCIEPSGCASGQECASEQYGQSFHLASYQ